MMRVSRLLKSTITLLVFFSGLFAGAASKAAGLEAQQSSFDLWDVSRRCRIVDATAGVSEMEPAALFGGVSGVRHMAENFIFVHPMGRGGRGCFAEWRMLKRVDVRSLRVSLAAYATDGPPEPLEIRFYSRMNSKEEWKRFHTAVRSHNPPPIPPGESMTFAKIGTNLVARGLEFKMVVLSKQVTGPLAAHSGAWMIEVDAFSSPVPPEECWDAFQEVRITGSSGLRPGVNALDLFGQLRSEEQAGRVQFREGVPAGYVSWVEWQTPKRKTPASFRLAAVAGREKSSLPLAQFRLYGYSKKDRRWKQIFNSGSIKPEQTPRLGRRLLFSGSLIPMETNHWRAEFVHSGDEVLRLWDLEGYWQPLEEIEPKPGWP